MKREIEHLFKLQTLSTERGRIGFSLPSLSVEGKHNIGNVVVLPLIRQNATFDQVSVHWRALTPAGAGHLVTSLEGRETFEDGQSESSISIILDPQWVEKLHEPVEIPVVLVAADQAAKLAETLTCSIYLLPGELVAQSTIFFH